MPILKIARLDRLDTESPDMKHIAFCRNYYSDQRSADGTLANGNTLYVS